MKLVTYKHVSDTMEKVGILHRNENTLEPISNLGLSYPTMNELITHMTKGERNSLLQKEKQEDSFGVLMEEVQIQPPIPVPRQDIICLGVNYTEHAKESARYKKEAFDLKAEYPVYFSKRVNRASGDGEDIKAYEIYVDSFDYEVELAVIIGKDANKVPLEKCKDYIFGYTILNDMSARNLQTRHKQWYLGKSLNGFAPMGPCIVTAKEVPYPPNLSLQSYVNGQLRQDSRTDRMIFDIDYVIHDLSRYMTLKAGTIIAMGTPSGVGMGLKPPKFLKPGDEVLCKIEKIGQLKNRII